MHTPAVQAKRSPDGLPTHASIVCLAALVAALSFGFGGAAARAQVDEQDELAREAHELGTRAGEDGRWRDAVRYYERSYELSARPTLLFELGVAHEHLGDRVAAVEHFERFLRELPEAENRAEVEARIGVLRSTSDAERPGRVPVPSAGPSSEGSALPWVMVGLGAANAGVGVAFLIAGRRASQRVEGTSPGTRYWDEVADDAHSARSFSILGGVLLGVGLAIVPVALALRARWSSGVEVGLAPDGLQVRGRF